MLGRDRQLVILCVDSHSACLWFRLPAGSVLSCYYDMHEEREFMISPQCLVEWRETLHIAGMTPEGNKVEDFEFHACINVLIPFLFWHREQEVLDASRI